LQNDVVTDDQELPWPDGDYQGECSHQDKRSTEVMRVNGGVGGGGCAVGRKGLYNKYCSLLWYSTCTVYVVLRYQKLVVSNGPVVSGLLDKTGLIPRPSAVWVWD